MTYQHFAYIYDKLMMDVPYDLWLEYFQKRMPSRKSNHNILDLACGTGSLSVPIAKMGYNVTGIDLSAEMLSVADEKARSEQTSIKFIQQDMTELEFTNSFETIVCFCDSINYLKDEEAVKSTFMGVYNALLPEGRFMFDVHSTEKIKSIFIDQTFVSNDDDVSFIWNCFEGDFPYTVLHELTFFVKNTKHDVYNRFDEVHVQRTYPIEMYKSWLEEAGFTSIEIIADFNTKHVSKDSERIFFYCEKK